MAILSSIIDSKGAAWAVEWFPPAGVFPGYIVGKSVWYPNPPLSGLDEDRPQIVLNQSVLIRESVDQMRMALENKINAFSYRHTRIEPSPIPSPTVPTAPPVSSTPTAPSTAATSTSTAVTKSQIVNAYDTVRSATTSLTPAARQIVLGIGLLENGYGLSDRWSFTDVKSGLKIPSYNWGAVMARPGDPYIEIPVRNPKTGVTEQRRFAAYNSQYAGYMRFYQVWGKPDTLAAAQSGLARGTARAMFNHGYYEPGNKTPADAIDLYARAIAGASKTVASALGQAPLVVLEDATSSPTSPKPSSTGTVVALAGLAGLGFLWLRGRS